MGSKMRAAACRTPRLVSLLFCRKLINSLVSNRNSSVSLFHVRPRTLSGFGPLISTISSLFRCFHSFCNSEEFVFHLHSFIPALDIISLALWYNLSAFSSLSAPVIKSSTYRHSSSTLTSSEYFSSYFFRWCLIVAASRKGLAVAPNGTRVILIIANLRSSKGAGLSLNHKNLSTSLSLSFRPICRKAFVMSAIIATLCCLNFINMLSKLGFRLGPVKRHSLSERLSLSWDDASNTIRNFVVILLSLIIGWWGI